MSRECHARKYCVKVSPIHRKSKSLQFVEKYIIEIKVVKKITIIALNE